MFDSPVLDFNGQQLCLPQRCSYYPEDEFVNWHAREVFQGPGRLVSTVDRAMDRSDREPSFIPALVSFRILIKT
jgi:hypothetical protein